MCNNMLMDCPLAHDPVNGLWTGSVSEVILKFNGSIQYQLSMDLLNYFDNLPPSILCMWEEPGHSYMSCSYDCILPHACSRSICGLSFLSFHTHSWSTMSLFQPCFSSWGFSSSWLTPNITSLSKPLPTALYTLTFSCQQLTLDGSLLLSSSSLSPPSSVRPGDLVGELQREASLLGKSALWTSTAHLLLLLLLHYHFQEPIGRRRRVISTLLHLLHHIGNHLAWPSFPAHSTCYTPPQVTPPHHHQ